MDLHEALGRILSASELVRADRHIGRIDASLYRSDASRTNIGLINAENLSIQIHINQVIPHGGAHDEPGRDSRAIPPMEANHAVFHDRTPPPPEPDRPRVVDRHLFDVRNTFLFNSDFVFEERRLTINTIPIHFIRTGERIIHDIEIRNVPRYSERFFVRDGQLCMSEGAFKRYEPPASDASGLEFHDKRLSDLFALEDRSVYRSPDGLLVYVFPADSGARLPLGRDDAVFPEDRFGPVYLVCVAQTRRHAPPRIRSHFYVVTDNDNQSRGQTRP